MLRTRRIKLAFKRLVKSLTMWSRPYGRFFNLVEDIQLMNIYIYSDESGVFDYIHNKYFVFGGLIILGNQEKETASRKYKALEKNITNNNSYYLGKELKASFITNREKQRIYNALRQYLKFGVVITEKKVHKKIFDNKKTKQRFLDYAYKRAVKKALLYIINNNILNTQDIDNIYFYIDQHSTATDGRYELKESIETEFKIGTFNYNYQKFYEPILPNLKTLDIEFCDSKHRTLIRAADIIANRIYYLTNSNSLDNTLDNTIEENLIILHLP